MLNSKYLISGGLIVVACGLMAFLILGGSDEINSAMPKIESTTDNNSDTTEQLSSILSEIKKSNAELVSKIEANQKQISSLSSRLDELKSAADDIKENPEEAIEKIDENEISPFQREKEVFETEVVDFSWAPKAEVDLESGLSTLGEEVGFTLLSTVCKTSRCLATVSFTNYEKASTNASHLVERVIPGLNCAQSITIPEPGNKSASYEAELLLDCSQQVAGKVQPIY